MLNQATAYVEFGLVLVLNRVDREIISQVWDDACDDTTFVIFQLLTSIIPSCIFI